MRITKKDLEIALNDAKFWQNQYAVASNNTTRIAGQNSELNQKLLKAQVDTAKLGIMGLKALEELARGYEQEIDQLVGLHKAYVAKLEEQHQATLKECAGVAAVRIAQAETNTLGNAFKYLADRVTPNQG